MSTVQQAQTLGAVVDACGRSNIPPVRLVGSPDVLVDDLVMDSRAVRTNSIFACVRGRQFDGHRFAEEAVAAGAVALLVDHQLELEVPQIVVEDVRKALGPIASIVHRNPSSALRMIGITGTNGKTTVAQMTASVLGAGGLNTRVIGTLEGTMTTPEAPDLQRHLANLRDEGVEVVVMEVSSHALAEFRTSGIDYEAVVFTNLGHDHLDVHGSVESYFRAKSLLFSDYASVHQIVSADDVHGRLLADTVTESGMRPRCWSLSSVSNLEMSFEGSVFEYGGSKFQVRLVGLPNVSNALASIETCRALGLSDVTIATGLSALESVPGRFEVFLGGGIVVVVDFAHTPEALGSLLDTCRQLHPNGPISIVFGCGGQRDRAKRPQMARIASERADKVVITSDNPRSEDPEAIIQDVLSGVPDDATHRVTAITDRAEAIFSVIRHAHIGEVVVVAGKGHERTQKFADRIVEFDDREHVQRALEERQ